MLAGALQQRHSTNIPSSSELGLPKGPSLEHSSTNRTHSHARDVNELQLRVDELEAEKAYFLTRIQSLERRLNESECRCAALEETQLAQSAPTTRGNSDAHSASAATSLLGSTHNAAPRGADTAHLQAQINELRHAVRELSERNSLPRPSSMDRSMRSELRSPPAINPELQKLREVILHQQHIIKALQGELDWAVSPSPANLLTQTSKSCTLPECREDVGLHAQSTTPTALTARSGSDSKEPSDPSQRLASGPAPLSSSSSPSRPGATDEPEPQPPQHVRTNTSGTNEDAEPFVMSYATLDPLAVVGSCSFDPFTGKAVRGGWHQRQQSDVASLRSTAAGSSRMSLAVQDAASKLQMAFADLDEDEEATMNSTATPPPRRAVLLSKLSGCEVSFGDLEEPSSDHNSPLVEQTPTLPRV